MPSADHFPRVLCIACSPRVFDILDRALRYSQFHILSAGTRDSGVAICVAEAISVAVLDAESIRGQECSVAKALKRARPKLPIILLEERQRSAKGLPAGVDAMIPVGAPEKLLGKIQELLLNATAKSRSAR